jgi:COP9 signalosome complex subunit 1
MESIHPNWDLDQYILNYTGHGQIQRLKYIALKSRALQVDALKYAIRLIKSNTLNVALYHETVEQLRTRAPNAEEAQLDQAWMDNATRTAKSTTEKLEAELKNYKNNLIKESIRVQPAYLFLLTHGRWAIWTLQNTFTNAETMIMH